jgi:hypothetical protein
MRWFSRKADDDTQIETADELVTDFDQQFGESQRRAAESRRKGSHYYREQARVDRAGTEKPSHKKKGWW